MNANLTINHPSSSTCKYRFHIKDPGSAITHFIAFVLSIILTPILLVHAYRMGADTKAMISFAIFMISMILLYGASTSYHTFDISPRINKLLKKIDHMMIFVLIAGSYTPICVIALNNSRGLLLLGLVWSLAFIGMIVKFFWVTCPKWFSSVIYIGMGWVCIFAMPQIIANLSTPGFLWLLSGGIIYTAGGIIYALKLSAFNNRFKHFGSHEIFHLFVMAGNFCHYIVMYSHLLS